MKWSVPQQKSKAVEALQMLKCAMALKLLISLVVRFKGNELETKLNV
jgi:hypothetical protein